MTDKFIMPLLFMTAGAGALITGIMRRRRARAFGATPCRAIGSLEKGTWQFIAGKAHSPVSLVSPVSKTPCVFYLEKIKRYRSPDGYRDRNGGWEELPPNAYGGFFVRDGSGTALVLPCPENIDLCKPEAAEDTPLYDITSDTLIKSELIIAEDEGVTVLGSPQTFGEFMQYLRANAELNIPSDLVKELVKMESDPGAGGLPCFFGAGVDMVADQGYDDYIVRTKSAASLPIQIGGILLIFGASALLYALLV